MTIRQDIRFCTTADGVRLAMALYGSGTPIVRAATWLTHIERDPTSAFNRHWIEELGRRHRYVSYDMRGCGLSSRRVEDISFEAWMRDLETVVDSLALDRFTLLGISQGSGLAVSYAARHPERVDKLVIVGGYPTSYFSTSNPDPRIKEEGETMLKLTELGWGKGSPAFRRVFVDNVMPHATREEQQSFDEYQHLSADPDVATRSLRTMFSVNVKDDATRVQCPTLVFHVRTDRMIKFEQGRKLASLIPGARFVPLDGDNHLPMEGDEAWPVMVRELRAFLGDEAEPVRLTERQQQVLRLVAGGRTDKEIARELALSPRTVEMHVAAAMKSLDCGTRAEAVAKAGAAGLLR